jgi:hypothetical protein
MNDMPDGGDSLRHKFRYFTALAVSGICLLFFLLPAVRQFLIIDYKTDKILYASGVKPGDKFSITYIHSVNKSPIEDQFIIEDDFSIMLQKTIFRSFGAGVPSTPDDGSRYVFFKDRIEVPDINRKIDNLLLFVGIIADHHFLMNGKDLKLNELSPPQRSVHFLIKKITVHQYFKYILNKQGGN